jgi:ribosome-binding factor A
MGKHEDGEGRARSRRRERQPAGIRSLRIEELFREEIRSLLEGELTDPRLDGVRVARVELSPDGARARIWYTIMSPEHGADSVDDALARASGYIRSRLCDALAFKRMPELSFRRAPGALAASELAATELEEG